MTSLNAADVYDCFDLDYLQTIADKIGPTPEELSETVDLRRVSRLQHVDHDLGREAAGRSHVAHVGYRPVGCGRGLPSDRSRSSFSALRRSSAKSVP